jgi:ATP-dependent DNA helicase RecQ
VCLLLISPGDMPLRRRLIERGGGEAEPDPEMVRHKWNLFLELMRLAEGGGCRHDAILRYFGDDEETLEGCGRCDVCLELANGRQDPDETAETVRKALCGVARVDGRFGLTAAAKLLRGADDDRLQRAGLDRTPTFGVLSSHSEEWLTRLLRRCITAGWVEFQGGDRPVVRVTREGMAVIHNRRPARLLLPGTDAPPQPSVRKSRAAKSPGAKSVAGVGARRAPRPARDTESEMDDKSRGVFDALRAFRLEEARRAAVPPYVIASDRTLRDLASLRPANLEELLLAHGIGPTKAERYGEALLRVIRRFAE